VTTGNTIPTPSTPDVCTVVVLVDGREIPNKFHILSINVSREVNRIPSASLQIEDGEAAKQTFLASNSEHFLPGKKIEIQLGYRSQNKTVFKGLVVKQRLKLRSNGSVLSVECFADAVKATLSKKSKYYIDKKDSDIMEDILNSHGLSKTVETTIPKLKDVVQYDSTDWDFLVCRAEANGQLVMVEDDKIKIAKPALGENPALKMAYGSTVIELDAEMDARWQSKGIKTTSWKAADQVLEEAEGKEPTAPQAGNVSASDLAGVLAHESDEIRHSGALDAPMLQALADARLLRMRLAKLRGRARCQGFAEIKPGNIVQISGIGERFEGKLFVSAVQQTVTGGNWETDLQFGLSPETFAQSHDLRPLPAAGLLPTTTGLQIGIVTALEDDPDGEDRIKCRLPLISASEEGIWARLATLDAGNARGTYFRPEIGDEVIIGFLNDDPCHAVILGMCHSSAKPAPEPAKDDNHKKGYVSREKLKLSFDDEKKIIGIETPAGNKITLSEDAKGITLKDQNNNKIIMSDSGIIIESAKDLILKAAKDVKLSGMNTNFEAQNAFKASGSVSAELTAAKTKVNGNAMTEIKGGLVQIN
jgi:Rhs element Vgr protein